MKTRLLIIILLFISIGTISAQAKIDSAAKPDEISYFDGPANSVFAQGFLLKTRSKNFYEITTKKKYNNRVANPEVKVYKEKKRKYLLVINGIEDPIPAVKVQDVIESNINGDFTGWDGSTSFKLLNGDVWVQDEIKTLFQRAIFRPAVFIFQSDDGSYKMKVAGIDEMLQVKKK